MKTRIEKCATGEQGAREAEQKLRCDQEELEAVSSQVDTPLYKVIDSRIVHEHLDHAEYLLIVTKAVMQKPSQDESRQRRSYGRAKARNMTYVKMFAQSIRESISEREAWRSMLEANKQDNVSEWTSVHTEKTW